MVVSPQATLAETAKGVSAVRHVSKLTQVSFIFRQKIVPPKGQKDPLM